MPKRYRRITQIPERSFFLLGPRGVGKSTWVGDRLAEAHRFDLLDEGLYQELLSDPSLFGAELETLPPDTWVVVDEVQRLPGLLNVVHRSIENRGLHFALLGSSARKLKTAGTNLLAGRAVRKLMFPFVPDELGEDFVLDDVLRFGSIPVVFMAQDRAATLQAYVQMYLKEEIRSEALVRNLPGFSRFLPIAALFHGQVINVSSIARDSGTARTTVDGYLRILEDTLLAYRLPAFEAKLRVRERKLPKLFWVDPGLVRQIQKKKGDVTSEEKGPLLEGFVLGSYVLTLKRATSTTICSIGRLLRPRSSRSTSCLLAKGNCWRSRSSPNLVTRQQCWEACVRSESYRASSGAFSFTTANGPSRRATGSRSGLSLAWLGRCRATVSGHETIVQLA